MTHCVLSLSRGPRPRSNVDSNSFSTLRSWVTESQRNSYDASSVQQLLGEKAGTVDGSILRELFLQRLPSNVRMVLASSPESVGIDNLATLADRITEVATSTSSVSSVEQPSQVSSELNQLRAEVADLRMRKLLQSSNRYHRRPRSATPSRRSSSPAPSRSSMDLCWYHSRFGDAARKCRSPCSKAGNTSASH